ncbi:MAG: hypothetical protein ACHQQ3_09085 [Gemmatimonadales bacterium]
MTRPGTASVVSALLALAACGKPPATAAPMADALIITADSSYWVTSDGKGLRMRGEPILITRFDGRFRELYVADDDRSFHDAVFVGQRMFVRDLVRGDSALLFADSVVPRMSREYAAAHPREAPIGRDEESSDKPVTNATADIEILDVHPPFLSFEYHSDLETDREHGGLERHTARRGVLDLRTGKVVSLEALFGREAAERAIAEAAAEWDTTRDSILARRGEGADEARRMLGAVAFDATSFSLDANEREPEVVFAVPSLTRRGATPPLELTARSVAAPPWWGAQRDELPTGPDSARSWKHGGAELVARTGDDQDRAKLVLRDAAHREWPLGSVTSPVQRVIWLDASLSPVTRRALRKAFNESSQNSEDTRIAHSRSRPVLRTSL